MHDYYSVYARVRDSRSVPNREWRVPIPNVRISAPEVDAVAPTSAGGFHALGDSLIYLRGRFFYLRGSLIYFLCRFSTPEGPMDQPIFAPFGDALLSTTAYPGFIGLRLLRPGVLSEAPFGDGRCTTIQQRTHQYPCRKREGGINTPHSLPQGIHKNTVWYTPQGTRKLIAAGHTHKPISRSPPPQSCPRRGYL